VVENSADEERPAAGKAADRDYGEYADVQLEDFLDKLQRMRQLGVRISIDDFGTGFCSFSYLLQYQVDRLKIDQSFVKKAGTDANAAAVVGRHCDVSMD